MGICNYNIWGKNTTHTILLRFDCDLSTDVNVPEMKKNDVPYSLEEYLSRGLTPQLKNEILKRNTLN